MGMGMRSGGGYRCRAVGAGGRKCYGLRWACVDSWTIGAWVGW